MSKGFASSYRIVLLTTGLGLGFGAVAARLVWLHVVDRDSLLKTIVEVRSQLIVETAQRGDILDARGARLATSRSVIVLGVDPAVLKPQDEPKLPQLATLLGLPEAELRRICLTKFREPAPDAAPSGEPRIALPIPASVSAATGAAANPRETDDDPAVDLTPDEKGRRPIRWAKLREDVPESVYAEIMALRIDAVYGRREYRRAYPSNELAAHLIGYVNREQKPVTGVELFADFYLRGRDGWRVGEKDARGRELAQFRTREVPRADGYSVQLSIDLTVQDIIEQELAALAQRFEPQKATIIVSDPRTGFILGMANYPTFNPNEYNKVPKEEFARMKNVAVADIYEPGSVFKIVPVAAALEEKLVWPQSVFDCTIDKVVHRGTTVSLPAEDHFMGELSVSEILSRSSNKGAAQLGLRLGEERLYRYARAFGFGTKLEFPVGGEVAGLLNPVKQWYPIDITRIPMGHSVSSTVLQMHQAMSVIANDGVLLRPQIIKQIRDSAGDVIYSFGPDKIRDVVSPGNARHVAEMLTGVVKKGGTAVEAAIDGFDVAGKTGTTQKFINGTWSKRNHIASFVGFFPAGNPRVAISVVVDDADHKAPNGVAYGRTVAAPSFKRIGERLIPILDIKPTRPVTRPVVVATHEGGRR